MELDNYRFLAFTAAKADAEYGIRLSTQAVTVSDKSLGVVAEFRGTVREIGHKEKHNVLVVVPRRALAGIKSIIEGNIIASRAVYDLLGTEQTVNELSEKDIPRLLEGFAGTKKDIKSEIQEYIDRRIDAQPKHTITLIEVMCAVRREPNKILMALNNLGEHERLLLGLQGGPKFPVSLEELEIQEDYQTAFDQLHSAVQICPGAEDKIRREAEAFRKRAVDQHVIDGPLRAFISYSTKDKHLAGQIKTCLEKYGLSVFLAHEDLKISDEWMDRIIEELKSCHVFIPLLTDNYKGSEWTDQEAGYALAFDKKVCPLKGPHNPHGFIRRKQGEFVTESNVEPACEKIIAVIREDEKLSPLLSKSQPKQVT